MRALVVTTSYPLHAHALGGRFVEALLHGFASRGWQFDVVTPGSATHGAGPVDHPTHVHVTPVPYPGMHVFGGLAQRGGIPDELARAPWKAVLVPGMLARLDASVAHHLRAHRYDLVWSHWLIPSGVLAARAARRAGVAHVATAHGGDVHLLEQAVRAPGVRAVLSRAFAHTRLTAPVRFTADRVARALGGARVTEVPLPALEPVHAAPRPAGDGLRVLYMGRFEPVKGPDLLLEAVARLDPRMVASVELAGTGSLAPALRRAAARLASPVTFAGVLTGESKRQALARAHCVVLPSRTSRPEGFPHVAAEALAMGTPVVAPRDGALGELIERTRAGIVYDGTGTGDPAGPLADALRQMSGAASRWRSIAAAARRAGAAFMPRRSLARWEAVLHTEMEGRA